jgi:transposase
VLNSEPKPEILRAVKRSTPASSAPENKVALGFVQSLNNKIRVIQRRAYGVRDEEYLRLRVLTCMLPQM